MIIIDRLQTSNLSVSLLPLGTIGFYILCGNCRKMLPPKK